MLDATQAGSGHMQDGSMQSRYGEGDGLQRSMSRRDAALSAAYAQAAHTGTSTSRSITPPRGSSASPSVACVAVGLHGTQNDADVCMSDCADRSEEATLCGGCGTGGCQSIRHM
jgi:hypothetical protein